MLLLVYKEPHMSFADHELLITSVDAAAMGAPAPDMAAAEQRCWRDLRDPRFRVSASIALARSLTAEPVSDDIAATLGFEMPIAQPPITDTRPTISGTIIA
jgi:hypothetical protein